VAVCDHLNDLRGGHAVAGHFAEIVLIDDQGRDPVGHLSIVIQDADGAPGDPLSLVALPGMRAPIKRAKDEGDQMWGGLRDRRQDDEVVDETRLQHG